MLTMLVSDVKLLHGNHDEADTRIVFYLDHLDRFDPGNVQLIQLLLSYY